MAALPALPPCPHCGEDPLSSLACLSCGEILPGGADSDCFTRLGLSPYAPFDAEQAEARYLQLSRILHPDQKVRADDDVKRAALASSALLNEAWRTLSDEQLRAEALLELHDPGALDRHKTLEPAFLMEAMELSEELEEAHASGCRDTVQRIAQLAQQAIAERMQGVSTACSRTIQRIARQGYVTPKDAAVRLLAPHDWDTEQIAILLHQARVYRRILKDTKAGRS